MAARETGGAPGEKLPSLPHATTRWSLLSSMEKISLITARRAWPSQFIIALGKEDWGRKSWSAKEKAKWLLEQEQGMFILQPAANGASKARIAAADAGAELLHDPMESMAWKLCEETLAASTEKPKAYVEVGEIQRLAKQRVKSPLVKRSCGKRGRKSRGKKQRQEYRSCEAT